MSLGCAHVRRGCTYWILIQEVKQEESKSNHYLITICVFSSLSFCVFLFFHFECPSFLVSCVSKVESVALYIWLYLHVHRTRSAIEILLSI
jgi:hypothetical protein